RANGNLAELRSLLEASRDDEAAAARAADLIEKFGGRQATEEAAAEHLDAALTALRAAELVPAVEAELVEVARDEVERQQCPRPPTPSRGAVTLCSPCRHPTGGGRASSTPTSRWTPRTSFCASSSACSGPNRRLGAQRGSGRSSATTARGPTSTAARPTC